MTDGYLQARAKVTVMSRFLTLKEGLTRTDSRAEAVRQLTEFADDLDEISRLCARTARRCREVADEVRSDPRQSSLGKS